MVVGSQASKEGIYSHQLEENRKEVEKHSPVTPLDVLEKRHRSRTQASAARDSRKMQMAVAPISNGAKKTTYMIAMDKREESHKHAPISTHVTKKEMVGCHTTGLVANIAETLTSVRLISPSTQLSLT